MGIHKCIASGLIILERFHLNPTQLAGVLPFTIAAVACVITARRAHRFRSRIYWAVLAVINLLFAIEVLALIRYQIHDFTINQILVTHGWHCQQAFLGRLSLRRLRQSFLVCVMFVLVRIAFVSWVASVASGNATALVGLFVIEGVSLHAIDLILWRPYHQIVFVAWLWMAGAGVITLAAIWRSMRPTVKACRIPLAPVSRTRNHRI